MRRLVLVHGLGVSGRYFDPLVRELVEFDCVVPELRRHATLEAQAEALRKVVGRPTSLLGNSMGCQVIAELAVRVPELVERAIFVGPTVDRRRRTYLQQGARLLLDALREPPSLLPIVVRDYVSTGPIRIARMARSAVHDALEREVPRMACPLLVVRGGLDPLCPADWAEELARLAPPGRLEVIPGAAHATHYSHPKELAETVRPFVEEPA
jgi:2-hydroxy-6-oxonona-2,4-dienedioate hydrolase